MRIFIYDADDDGNEVSLTGDSFKQLIEICFTYSSYFSLVVNREIEYKLEAFSAFLVEERLLLPNKVGREKQENAVLCIRFYRANPKTMGLLLGVSDDFWKLVWYWGNRNPEDLTFYREDPSVFMRSIAHEGEAIFTLLPNEDVSRIFAIIPSYRVDARDDWLLRAGIREECEKRG